MSSVVYFYEPKQQIFDDEKIYLSICHGLQVQRDTVDNYKDVAFLITNEADAGIFEKAKSDNSEICSILITSLPVKDYCKTLHNREEELVDHVISINPVKSWHVEDLRILLQKHQKNDKR